MPILKQDIVDWKTALQTAITPVRAHQIWWTLVHKRRIRCSDNYLELTSCWSHW